MTCGQFLALYRSKTVPTVALVASLVAHALRCRSCGRLLEDGPYDASVGQEWFWRVMSDPEAVAVLRDGR